MIAKGTPHNNGAKLAAYLTVGKEDERAMLWELRGFASDDIREAFRSVHVMAEAMPQLEHPFFHVQVRNPEGEKLSREQWLGVANRIETKLRLDGQPRAIAFHESTKTGHEHMHLVWSRIDDSLTARCLPFYKLRLKEVCRELEIDLDLTRVTDERRGQMMAPLRHEFEQARRLGVDIHKIRAAIRTCWDHSDNGRSFAAGLAEQGLMLSRGDRRAFIAVDSAGGMHALGKRVLGQGSEDIHARLSDLDCQTLPTVQEARQRLGCKTRTPPQDELDLVSSIEHRDAGAVLEVMTRRRATFTAHDLKRAVRKHIEDPSEQAKFSTEILSHPQIVPLMDDDSTPRFTTTAVLESEQHVLRVADELARWRGHEVGSEVRTFILRQEKYTNISREQVRALRQATSDAGIALIDGQAGTGKSFIMSAIREAYEVQGRRVIGLAPTNTVAQDMAESGFSRARTLHSELFALERGNSRWNQRTVVILDEAAMVDTRHMGMIVSRAREAGAKVILVGDDRQLSSIERGGMFGVLRERLGAAELREVRRQRVAEDRVASRLMASGHYREALLSYQKKDQISWADTQSQAADALVQQWTQDSALDPEKSRFVFAYTNQEVDELNAAIRSTRLERGELGPPTSIETKHGRADFAQGDQIQFTGTNKPLGIFNGHAAIVRSLEGDMMTAVLDGKRRKIVSFDVRRFRDFRHGYAGTIYRGQGRTIDQTYLFHSEHWRAATSYVALTRHTIKARLFVPRDTAATLDELASQMSRIDDRRAASHFRRVDPARYHDAPVPPSPLDWHSSNGERDFRGSSWQHRELLGREQVLPQESPPGALDSKYSRIKDSIRGQFRKLAAYATQRMSVPKRSSGRRRSGQTGRGLARAGIQITRRAAYRTMPKSGPSFWNGVNWLHLWQFPGASDRHCEEFHSHATQEQARSTSRSSMAVP